jgi:hypothetical protein
MYGEADESNSISLDSSGEWLYGIRDECAGKTDEELAEMAAGYYAYAKSDNVYVPGILEQLIEWRDKLTAEKEDEKS